MRDDELLGKLIPTGRGESFEAETEVVEPCPKQHTTADDTQGGGVDGAGK